MAWVSLYDWCVRGCSWHRNYRDSLETKNLLYGKEEHSLPQIEPSALQDQIEDIIFKRVRRECLNVDQEGVLRQ